MIDYLPTESGVYAIVNVSADGARYVGKAKNIRNRIKTHVHDLDLGLEATNDARLLQTAWSAYGRESFTIEILERVADNENAVPYSIRADNLSLAEHYYINERGEYNADKKIVRSDQVFLVNAFAWREPVDADTVARALTAVPYAYIVGSRILFEHAVLVSAFNETEAKQKARDHSPELRMLDKKLSSVRASLEMIRTHLGAELPDYRETR